MSHFADGPVQFTREFWDERYGSAGQLWSGEPNPQLVAQTAGLVPGSALDAGCGEGADVIQKDTEGCESEVPYARPLCAAAGVRREPGRTSRCAVYGLLSG